MIIPDGDFDRIYGEVNTTSSGEAPYVGNSMREWREESGREARIAQWLDELSRLAPLQNALPYEQARAIASQQQ